MRCSVVGMQILCVPRKVSGIWYIFAVDHRKAADSAASKVVEKSGLTGEAAGIANSMAQEALRKGLGSAGSGQGTESSGTVTAPTYDPSQDSGESDDFDWSQIQSEFDSLKDEFPS